MAKRVESTMILAILLGLLNRTHRRKPITHPLQVYNSSHEELFVYIKIYDVIEEKVVVICSRLRERNKKDKEIMLETTRNLKKS